MTTIYLIRHSKKLDTNNYSNDDNLQIQNEKYCLSIKGEEIAKERLNNPEFNNIDVLFSSNYVRAIQTAKYISNKNNIDINIISDLGERKIGIKSWDELPDKFERKQFLDENYKIGDGESQKEVKERMYNTLMKIIKENQNKRIAIVSHGTAISFLLKVWCDITLEDDKLKYTYNDKVLLHNYLDYCETFKLTFDNNNLINIENIKLKEN